MIFCVALVLLVVRPVVSGRARREAASGGWFRERPLPAVLRPWRAVAIAGSLAAAIAAPFLTDSPGRQFQLASVPVFALMAVSTTVITGWAGQVSLCQFAFVGLGAVMTSALTTRGMPFGFALIYSVAAAAAAAVLVGLPAVRIRGLFLAAATLGFAVAANGWLFSQGVFLTGSLDQIHVDRPSLGPLDLADQRTYYFVCLAVLVVVMVVVSGLRRTGVGRSIVAVRDNELQLRPRRSGRRARAARVRALRGHRWAGRRAVRRALRQHQPGGVRPPAVVPGAGDRDHRRRHVGGRCGARRRLRGGPAAGVRRQPDGLDHDQRHRPPRPAHVHPWRTARGRPARGAAPRPAIGHAGRRAGRRGAGRCGARHAVAVAAIAGRSASSDAGTTRVG